MGKLPSSDETPDEESDGARVQRLLAQHVELDALANSLANGNQPLFGAFIGDEGMHAVRQTVGPELDRRRERISGELTPLLDLPARAPGSASVWEQLREAARTPARAQRFVRYGDLLPVQLWLELFRDNAGLREALSVAPPRSSNAAEVLEAELSNPDRTFTLAVIRALGYLGDQPAQRALRARLTASTVGDPATRAGLITAIVRCTGNVHEFTQGSVADRAAAVEGALPSVASQFLGDDQAPEVSAAARRAINGVEPKGIVAAVLAVLSASPTASRSALELLEPHVEAFADQLIAPLTRVVAHPTPQHLALADALLARAVVACTAFRAATRHALRAQLPPGSSTAAALERRRAALLPPPAPEPEAGFEEADPGSPTWQRYADQLTAAGDLRGEAISRARKGSPAQTFLTKHPELMGPLPALLGKQLTQFRKGLEYRNGLIRRARVTVPPKLVESVTLEDVLEALLAAPATLLIQELELGRRHEFDGPLGYAAAVDVLADAPHARGLRSLTLGAFADDEFDDDIFLSAPVSYPEWGDLSALWSALPLLTTLRICGGEGRLGEVVAPRLERLAIETTWLNVAVVGEVLRMQAPALSHLELWFGDAYAEEARVAEVEKLLARDWPRLKVLRLRNANFTDAIFGTLARSKLLPQLEVLDLSLGGITDEAADELVRHAAAFQHLAELSFDENQLGAQGVAALRKAFLQATFKGQRDADDAPSVAVSRLTELAERSSR